MGFKKSDIINKITSYLRKNHLGSISSGSGHRSCDPRDTKAATQVGSETWKWLRVSHGAGLGVMKAGGLKESWREAEPLYQTAGLEFWCKGHKVIGEGVALVSKESLSHWKCQDYHMSANDSGRHKVEPA